MAKRRTLSIDRLAIDRELEIEAMLDGIQGKPEGVLWTSRVRAATRGGAPKCMAIPMIESIESASQS